MKKTTGKSSGNNLAKKQIAGKREMYSPAAEDSANDARRLLNPLLKLPNIQTDEYIDLNTPNVFLYDSEIYFCGECQCSPNTTFGPGVRSHFLLLYIKSGKGVYRTRNTLYHLSAGATFFMFPGEQVFYMADEEDPWHYYWIAFEGDYFANILKRAEISPTHSIALMPENRILPELYEKVLIYAASHRSSSDVKIISLTLDILFQYLENAKQREPLHVDPLSDHIERAIDYICKHFSEDISVSQIAATLGITREHFSFLFKKSYSTTPARFIRTYRLQRAMILLTSTDFSIEQIAERTGFNSYNYFSNQFKIVYGISPSQLRKEKS